VDPKLLGWGIAASLLALGGCGGNGPAACKISDALDWSDDPVRWAREADGDGNFAVQTGWAVQTTMQGNWNAEAHAYRVEATYDNDSYLESSVTEGFLEVLSGGDYRMDVEVETEDENGERWSFDLQSARVGCVESHVSEHDDGRISLSEVSLGVGEYGYTSNVVTADGGAYTQQGTIFQDGTAEEEGEFVTLDEQGTFEEESDWIEFEGRRQTWGEADDYEYDQVVEWEVDGTNHYEIAVDDDDYGQYEWDYTIDYDGNGGGTLTYDDGTECEVTFDEWVRSIDC
jgi:hypothetical protein